jgi:hypothetical protein
MYDLAKNYGGISTKGGLTESWRYILCISTICLPAIGVVAGVAVNLKVWWAPAIEADLRFLTGDADANDVRRVLAGIGAGEFSPDALLLVVGGLKRISQEEPRNPEAFVTKLVRLMYTYTGESMSQAEITEALAAIKSGELEKVAQDLKDRRGLTWFFQGIAPGYTSFSTSGENYVAETRQAATGKLVSYLSGVLVSAWLASNYWQNQGGKVLWICSVVLYLGLGLFLYNNMRQADFVVAAFHCMMAAVAFLYLRPFLNEFLSSRFGGLVALGAVFMVFGFEYLGAVWLRRSAGIEAASLAACVAVVPVVLLEAGLRFDEVWKLGFFGSNLSSAMLIAISAVSYSLIAPLAKARLVELMARPR